MTNPLEPNTPKAERARAIVFNLLAAKSASDEGAPDVHRLYIDELVRTVMEALEPEDGPADENVFILLDAAITIGDFLQQMVMTYEAALDDPTDPVDLARRFETNVELGFTRVDGEENTDPS